MNFSELFKHSSKLVSFSASGSYIACASTFKLLVQDVKTLQTYNVYTCLDTIQDMKWSPDSMFILCVMLKRGIVQVWSIEHPEWTCKIDEGSAGLLGATWSPDSRHVLTTAEFHLRVTLWSLTDKSVSYMKYPKSCSQNLSFSPGGKYLALAERRNLKDHVSILDATNWQLVKHIECGTEDLDGVEWSPDARVLAVWESCLRHGVSLYSLDGRLLHNYSAYGLEEGQLGVKCVSWSTTGQLLAIGSYDQKCRILNHVNWRCFAVLGHPLERPVDPSTESVCTLVIYQEVGCAPTGYPPRIEQTRYQVVQEPILVPHIRPDSNKPNPKIGVGLAVFSPDNRYLATRNDNQPSALWIWEVSRLALTALLLHMGEVKAIAWDPVHSGRLALVTGQDRVYMWSPQGCLAVQVPGQAGFNITQLSWHRNGDAILLIGDSEYCLCFLDEAPTDESAVTGAGDTSKPKCPGVSQTFATDNDDDSDGSSNLSSGFPRPQ